MLFGENDRKIGWRIFMRKLTKRLLSLLLCVVMMLGIVPPVANATTLEESIIVSAESLLAANGVYFPVKSYTACLTYGSPTTNYSYSTSKARFDEYGTDWWGSHHGTEYFAIDLSGGGASSGSPVYAVADGTVVWWRSKYGQIVIKHTVPLTLSDGKTVYNTWYSTYVHMKNVSVSEGNKVSGGQKIGEVGKTGTNAVHLHFSLSTALYKNKYTFHSMILLADLAPMRT